MAARTHSKPSASRLRDYCALALAYAERAADDANAKTFGKWVRLAARRFIADLKIAQGARAPFTFDPECANHACGFIECLPHVEGTWDTPNIVLHESHVFFLVCLFGFRRPDGGRRFTTALFATARKNAKALALDTPIPTPNGWRLMRDVHAGDEVFGADGKPCRVITTSEVFIGKPCYRVAFSDGSEVVASADHLWMTKHGHRRCSEVVSTEQIAQSVRMSRADGMVAYNHAIPVAGSLWTPDVDLPLDPYLLGAWLGDGTTAAAHLTCGDSDVGTMADEVRRVIGGAPVVHRYSSAWRISLTTGRGGPAAARAVKVQPTLRRLGVLGNKHIPNQYLWAGTEQRRALLQGLMDTDGTVVPTGLSGAVSCSFTSTNRALADGALQLVRSLGMKATLCEREAKIGGRVIGPSYLVQFTAWADDRVFRLSRKLDRLKPRPTRRTRSSTLKIIACEPCDSVQTKCLMVDSPDHLFLAGPGMVPTHNSTLAAGVGLYCQTCEKENGPQVIAAATTGQQARVVFKYAKTMVERTSGLRSAFGLDPFANSIASYSNGGSFKPINAKASTQDGLNPSCTILDEIHAHKTHDLLNVLKSAAGARKNPLFLFLTTEGYENAGPWPELRDFAKQVLEGIVEADHFLAIYYAVDDEDKSAGIKADDDFDEGAWIKANPLMDVNPILVNELRKEAIEAKAMPGRHAEFKIKRLNRPSSVAGGWVNLTKWRQCAGAVDLDKLRAHPCWGGLDLASVGDLSAFRLVWNVDGHLYTHGWRFVPNAAVHRRTERGLVPYHHWVQSGHLLIAGEDVTDYDEVMRVILGLHQRFNIRAIGYDPWNAAQIAQKLKDAGVPMEAFIQGPKSYHPAMQALERAYTAGKLSHGNDPVLNWCASNLVARTDVNMNTAPDKKRALEKIDDMVALLMGVGVPLLREPETPKTFQMLFV